MAAQIAPASILLVSLVLLGGRAADLTLCAAAPGAPPLHELWVNPADLERRDLTTGRWSPDRAPRADESFVYVAPKTGGSSPGLKVLDARGRTWHVKQGREAQPEVLLSHVLSAIGYRQPPVYYLRSFTLIDGSGTRVIPGGRFRLAEPSLRSLGPWEWERNPFVGTKPYQALLVVLVLLNSADLKNSNNTLYDVAAPDDGVRHWYVVRDLGTSLGGTGRLDPTPNDPHRFERRRFVTGVSDGYVEFDDYRAVHRDLVDRSITPDDVGWASRLLGRLTEPQWQQAFLGAGYDPEDANRFVPRILEKIEEGRTIGRARLPMPGFQRP